MNPRIVFPGSIETHLRTWLTNHPEGHERGAIVLFRKIDRLVEGLERSARFVAVEVIELDNGWVLESSRVHLRVNLRMLQPLYLRCEQENLELGFIHSHPDGAVYFSETDDQNEQNILRGYAGCNGLTVSLISMILCEGKWIARTRPGNDHASAIPVRHISVFSDQIVLHLGDAVTESTETLQRQEAAFGKPFNQKLQSLRVVVVGAGGTGSPLATLLARSGVGELVIIDGDVLEETNLNRVRGYSRSDVGNNKAGTLATYINSLGLPCRAVSIPEYADRSSRAIDAIATADIVFGCTDDVAGRDILTQAAYYYCLGYIDVGLTGMIGSDEFDLPYLRDHRGRISTILPEYGACLRCQGVVTEQKLAYERAVRERPELKELDPEKLRREYYLTGGQESAPGVGPFTSAVADIAVASFMNLLRRYRRLPTDLRQDNLWIDFVHLNFYSNLPKRNPSCFCCGQPGLLNASEGGYRLGMPSLGKIP